VVDTKRRDFSWIPLSLLEGRTNSEVLLR
jgi:hypothetical protein